MVSENIYDTDFDFDLNPLLFQYLSLKTDLDVQIRESKQAQELAVERAITQTEKNLQEQISKLRDDRTRLEVQIEILSKNKE